MKDTRVDTNLVERSKIRVQNDEVRGDVSSHASLKQGRVAMGTVVSQNFVSSYCLPSAALVTASSGTLSSVNFATERLMGKPCAIEKDAQADVAAGRAAKINAVTFILDVY